MNIEQQVFSIEQANVLEKLGMDFSLATMGWVLGVPQPYVEVINYNTMANYLSYRKTYNIDEIIYEFLPSSIEHKQKKYKFHLTKLTNGNTFVSYYNAEEETFLSSSHRYFAIDAIYELLIDLIGKELIIL